MGLYGFTYTRRYSPNPVFHLFIDLFFIFFIFFFIYMYIAIHTVSSVLYFLGNVLIGNNASIASIFPVGESYLSILLLILIQF